jgi:hypothetical protein
MDSRAQTTPRHSEIINELMSYVTQGFDSPNSPQGLRNHERTAITSDARIRQREQPQET